MAKRAFWFTTGATAGFGGAMWIRRQVLRTVRRYTPEQVQADVSTSVRRLGSDLREAVTTGRTAMADREAELRSELEPDTGTAGGGATAATDVTAATPATAAGRPGRPGRTPTSPLG